jgi:hypothetical protein
MSIRYFIFLFLTLSSHAFAQTPQFKFYLAFEDAKHEKDTVWIIIDQSATNGLDTAFGEDTVSLDSSRFQVYFGYDFPFKIDARKIGSGGSYSTFVRAINYVEPIMLRWDTNLLINNGLPFQIKQAWIYNDYLWANGYPDGFELINEDHLDSIRLDSYMMGGGLASHFPMKVTISSVPKGVGIEGSESSSISIYPNPASQLITINSPFAINSAQIRNGLGQIVKLIDGNTSSVSELPNGIYTLEVETISGIKVLNLVKI